MLVVNSLVLIFFGSPRLENTMKKHCIGLQTVNLEKCSISIFAEGSGTLTFWDFVHDFSRKMFLMLCSIN